MSVCICCASPGGPTDLERFSVLRDQCPALKEVYFRSGDWRDQIEHAECYPDRANHQSIVFLAYQRDYLHLYTRPIHEFLLAPGAFGKQINGNYMKDLEEKWLSNECEMDRHEKARGFLGKLSELLCAGKLKELGWTIENLEAWNGLSDIEARSPENELFVFEVKFIGVDSKIFRDETRQGVRTISPNQLHDFLLLKIYEGAKQLSNASTGGKKEVIIVIDSRIWDSFKRIIRNGRLNLDAPRLLYNNVDDKAWLEFTRKQEIDWRDECAVLQLRCMITKVIDAVHICSLQNGTLVHRSTIFRNRHQYSSIGWQEAQAD